MHRRRLPYLPLLAAVLALLLAAGQVRAEGSIAPRKRAEIGLPPAPIRFLLSFDDGPSGAERNNPTARVLDTLANNSAQPGIKVIFFVQTRHHRGGATEVGKALLRREQEEGHLLGFHTGTHGHSNHRYLEREALERSLEDGMADLAAIAGAPPTLVRPPFWNYDAGTLASYEKRGMRLLLTDLNANDGKIWGVNFSLHKRSNMLEQLAEVRERWLAGALPVVDGSSPVVVTFHDVNTYTARTVDTYLNILLDVARELEMPLAAKPFYDDRRDLERAALASAVRDGEVRPRLPGLWNWLWQ